MTARTLLLLLASLSGSRAETVTYWIEPCRAAQTGCETGDGQLARFALESWQRASAGALTIVESPQPKARIRLLWASGREGLYGEARGISVEGQPGAELLIRPALGGLGKEIAGLGARDPLFRDTVIYLTCLHELGHAFGLPHTRDFADIMYNFAFGGDIREYFIRYRRKLRTREEIAAHSGLSEEDVRRLRMLYPANRQ